MKTLSKIITLASGITMLFASSVCYAGGPGAFASPGRSLGAGRLQHGPGGSGSGGGGNGGSGGSSGREESSGGKYASPAGPPNNSPVDHPTKAESPVDEINTSLEPADDPVSTTSGDKEEVCDTASCLTPNRSDASVTDTLTSLVAESGKSPAGDSDSSDEPDNVDNGWRTKGDPSFTIIQVLQGAIDAVTEEHKALHRHEEYLNKFRNVPRINPTVTDLKTLQAMLEDLLRDATRHESFPETNDQDTIKNATSLALRLNESLSAKRDVSYGDAQTYQLQRTAVEDALGHVKQWANSKPFGAAGGS